MSQGENLTDLGNARRMVRYWGKNIRYCERMGGWYLWDLKRWAKDELRGIELQAKDTIKEMYAEAKDMMSDVDRKALVNHALRSESAARIQAMIQLARSETEVAVFPDEFDANPHLLNVENGVIDLRTGTLHPHDRKYLITKLAPVEYDPRAKAPFFKKFLDEIVTPEVADYLQRLVGLSLLGKVKEHVLLFLYGRGANGKTTFIRTVQALFGDYAKQGDPELLLARRGEPHPTGVADLVGTRMVVTTEVADGRRLAEALVKQLTGGDKVKARFMHRDFFAFDPTWTIWMAANHRPTIRGQDEGIWRRVKLIPFEVTIPPENQDPDLVDKLREELPGILNWAIQGCLDYQRNGLQEPLAVRAATNQYRTDSDGFGSFLDEETDQAPDLFAGAGDLFGKYKEWCDRTGERRKSQNEFGSYLQERGFERRKHPTSRRWTYYGIGLKNLGSETPRNTSHCFPSNPPHERETPEGVSQGFADRLRAP